MSYNINRVELLVFDARMRAGDLCRFARRDDLPECSFLKDAVRIVPVGALDETLIQLPTFSWYGEQSGRTYVSVLLKEIAPKVLGCVDAIFTWEGGDSFTGLRIVDGVVTEMVVARTLVPKGAE